MAVETLTSPNKSKQRDERVVRSSTRGCIRRRAAATEGRRLAVAMLDEMRELGADLCIEDGKNRGGAPQSDVLARYLARLVDEAAAGRDDVGLGFIAVLTDFIGSALDGAIPDLEIYEATL